MGNIPRLPVTLVLLNPLSLLKKLNIQVKVNVRMVHVDTHGSQIPEMQAGFKKSLSAIIVRVCHEL